MESGDAMEPGARDVLFLCARMNAHFSVGSGSPSCRLDSEPVLTVDSAYIEAAAMDHAIITVDAGVGSKEKKAGSGSKGASKRKCQNIRKQWIMMHAIAQTMLLADISSSCNLLSSIEQSTITMPIHKKFIDNNIHIHRAAHRTDNNTDNLLGQQQQIPVNIFNLQQQLPNARK
uniref:Uncharacterized protein n=1 Tax=Oryza barthii TaxID=65489 RepID=A0A0D3H031_9ORYZ